MSVTGIQGPWDIQGREKWFVDGLVNLVTALAYLYLVTTVVKEKQIYFIEK